MPFLQVSYFLCTAVCLFQDPNLYHLRTIDGVVRGTYEFTEHMRKSARSSSSGSLIHDVSRLRRNVIDQAMRPHGITRAQWWILANLSAVSEGINQTALAQKLNMTPMSLGESVGRLEAAGYVRRFADEQDRRANLLQITAAGQDVVGKMATVDDSINQRIMNGVSRDELAALERVLFKLRDNLLSLEAEQDDPDKSPVPALRRKRK